MPLTTSQTSPWTSDCCVGEKLTFRLPSGQRNVVVIAAPVLPPLVLPPGQNADSPMRDPLDLARVFCSVGDARLDQDRVAGHRDCLLGRKRDRSDTRWVAAAAATGQRRYADEHAEEKRAEHR